MENNNRESFAAAAAAAVASAATDSKHTLSHREANKQPTKPDREIEREKRDRTVRAANRACECACKREYSGR